MPTSHWPGSDRLHQQRVIREKVGREIGDPAAHDLLGLLFAVLRNQHRDQRLVVDRLRSAQAQPALPLGIGQRFVAVELFRLHPFSAVDDRARANGQAEPALLRDRARCSGILAFRIGESIGRSKPQLRRVPEHPGIDGNQQIRRRIPAFGGQSFESAGPASSVMRRIFCRFRRCSLIENRLDVLLRCARNTRPVRDGAGGAQPTGQPTDQRHEPATSGRGEAVS